jgi:release factor glutamine methyltransferase
MLSPENANRIGELGGRRLRREPIAYIVGEKEFWTLTLRVTAATLVPRPETETIVEAALAVVPDRTARLRIADLGTGTGAILLALLSEWPNAFGVAVDWSAQALGVARENAVRLALQHRAAFVRGDFAGALGGRFDLMVSNPPYIESETLAALAAEVRAEPALALDGGADGLDAYRRIAADAHRLLAPGGSLILEIGAGQAAAVTALFAQAGLRTTAPPRKDLAGIERALTLKAN